MRIVNDATCGGCDRNLYIDYKDNEFTVDGEYIDGETANMDCPYCYAETEIICNIEDNAIRLENN